MSHEGSHKKCGWLAEEANRLEQEQGHLAPQRGLERGDMVAESLKSLLVNPKWFTWNEKLLAHFADNWGMDIMLRHLFCFPSLGRVDLSCLMVTI